MASVFFGACSTAGQLLPSVYKIDIQQGNIITPEMVDQLRPGMNKRQVHYVMGTPLVVDVFHQERWDYIFSNQPADAPRVQNRLSLYFEGDTLVGLQGDFRPSETPASDKPRDTTVPVPKREQEKTVLQKVKGWFGVEESE